MYKISKNSAKNIELQRPKIELRSKNKVKFKYKFTNKTKVQNSPYYRGEFLWSQLPDDLQSEEKLNNFKHRVHILIQENKVVFYRQK